jgi:outer membrane protein assembly factor BamE
MRVIKNLLSVAIIIGLSACSIYKLDIQQGNVITQEMIEKLKIGMDMGQINHIVGTPLVKDPFRIDRWEYVYSMNTKGDEVEQFSHVSLFFKDSKLSDIQIKKEVLKREELESLLSDRRKEKSRK